MLNYSEIHLNWETVEMFMKLSEIGRKLFVKNLIHVTYLEFRTSETKMNTFNKDQSEKIVWS